jgi:hypothetical protein
MMKLEFDVWINKSGEVHLTCDDPQLSKPINIRAREGLTSTEVLLELLRDQERKVSS